MSYTRLSRYLSLILRHHPEAAGITLDAHGWAEVDALIAGIQKTRPFSREILEEIVRTDSKQRYAFNADKTRIRACQGHSVRVDVEPQVKTPPGALYHGTAERSVSGITREGLLPMGRLYVHLSPDFKTARAVGSRHGSPVVYRVDCARMQKDGFDFCQAENGVWLVRAVPPEYLQRLPVPT